MASEERGQFSGLFTAIAESLAPQGALRVADNVVIRRIGCIEPRSGWKPDGPTWADALFTWLCTIPASSVEGVIQLYLGPGGFAEAWYRKSGEPIVAEVISEDVVRLRADTFSHVFSRGNTYIASSTGMVRFSSVSNAWFSTAISVTSVSGATNFDTGTLINSGEKVGYRVVVVYSDDFGFRTQSRPTGMFYFENNTAGPLSPQVHVEISSTYISKVEAIEVYRTRTFPIGISTDDELALVKTFERDELSLGVFFTDNTADENRGAALYTSPSQGGFENANISAPACTLVELYKGSVFFANIIGPYRLVTSFNYSLSFLTGIADGIGLRVYSATGTAGNNQITVSSAVGLQVGSIIITSLGSLSFPFGDVHITAISGNVLTMTVAPITSGTSDVTFDDAVIINGSSFAVSLTNVPMSSNIPGNMFVRSDVIARNLGAYYVTPPVVPYDYTIVFESIRPNVFPFSVAATHGDEYSPPLPLGTGTPKDAVKDVYPNGILYSLQDRPEHVPQSSFQQIAARSFPILGMSATRDSLFLLKQEGIWRISGQPFDLAVDAFDLTTFCILPSSVQKLDNKIIFLSSRGIVSLDETGVVILSEPIFDQVARLIDDVMANYRSLGYYKISGVDGVTATVDVKTGEYMLLTGGVLLDFGGDCLVYNTRSGAWTTQSFKSVDPISGVSDFAGIIPTGMGVDATNRPVILQKGNARVPSDDVVMLDSVASMSTNDGNASTGVTSIAFSDAGQTQARVTTVSAIVVSPGDVYVDSSGMQYRIAVVESVGQFLVDLLSDGVLPAGGSCTIYRAVESTVQLAGFVQPRPVNKLWTQATWSATRFVGPVKVQMLYSSSEPAVPETEQEIAEEPFFVAPTGFAVHHNGILLQSLIPSDHQRAWLIRYKLKWSGAFARVSIESAQAMSRENVPNRTLNSTSGTS